MPNSTYARRRREGRCGVCEALAVPGRSRCETHLSIARQQRQTAYYRYKAIGLCGLCGARPEEAGQVCCNKCKASIEAGRAAREARSG